MQIIRSFALNLRKIKSTQNRENSKKQNKIKKQNLLKTIKLTILSRLKFNVAHQSKIRLTRTLTKTDTIWISLEKVLLEHITTQAKTIIKTLDSNKVFELYRINLLCFRLATFLQKIDENIVRVLHQMKAFLKSATSKKYVELYTVVLKALYLS